MNNYQNLSGKTEKNIPVQCRQCSTTLFWNRSRDSFVYTVTPAYASTVALVSVNAGVGVNVDNKGEYRYCCCKRVYNNGTVSANVDSNGSDLSSYCHRLH